MIPADFAEKTYEWPLYNQLQRANPFVYSPSQVLERITGFDAGLRVANNILWQTVGYSTPPSGVLLGSLTWPLGLRNPAREFPDVRLNLFLQAKRPNYYPRRPRILKNLGGVGVPLWAFRVTDHQQKLLESLAQKTKGHAHVAYAAAAFHTNDDLYVHMTQGTIVENSTFPSAERRKGHEAWYYSSPGAAGAANPNPEHIEEVPLLDRILALAQESKGYEPRDLSWLNITARELIEAALTTQGPTDVVAAHFFNDLQTMNRLAELNELPASLLSYAQIGLFTIRFDLEWFVVTNTT
jgi:hypothetical protein